MLFKPTSGLRFLATAITIVLIVSLFVPDGFAASKFLTGLALGLSVGVLAMVWNKQLQWHDQSEPSKMTKMNLGDSGR